jgi:hypothetical protein
LVIDVAILHRVGEDSKLYPMKLLLCVVAFGFAFFTVTYSPTLEGHNALQADFLAPDPTTQDTSAADGARIVDASSIRDAVKKHERIELRHAVFGGVLNFRI